MESEVAMDLSVLLFTAFLSAASVEAISRRLNL